MLSSFTLSWCCETAPPLRSCLSPSLPLSYQYRHGAHRATGTYPCFQLLKVPLFSEGPLFGRKTIRCSSKNGSPSVLFISPSPSSLAPLHQSSTLTAFSDCQYPWCMNPAPPTAQTSRSPSCPSELWALHAHKLASRIMFSFMLMQYPAMLSFRSNCLNLPAQPRSAGSAELWCFLSPSTFSWCLLNLPGVFLRHHQAPL